jgi:Formate hydrogenlyase subunit 6/NADH:ubiquinone oxidoreductase 23 kD subunit (chain I)
MNICPVNCISMKADEEGCEYPSVDVCVCIGCGKCERVCPVLSPLAEEACDQEAFLVQNKDERVLLQSTSGGAFSALAESIIEEGGVVWGSGYAPDSPALVVTCFAVDTVGKLQSFRNSKYLQSSIGYAFRKIEEQLRDSTKVLFSGTPCPPEGLIRYLGRPFDNLILVDVVCRAVPSNAVFASYLEWLEAKTGKKATQVRFRDKRRYGYHYSNICAFEHDSEEPFYSAGVESDPYLRAFFSNICDRPCCYECRFKKRYRRVDLTLWDCFDVGRFSKTMNNNKGATRVLVHSEKGALILKDIQPYAHVEQIEVDRAIDRVNELFNSARKNPKRSIFMEDLLRMDGCTLMETWFPDNLRVKAERLGRRVAERFGVYDTVKFFLKKLLGK